MTPPRVSAVGKICCRPPAPATNHQPKGLPMLPRLTPAKEQIGNDPVDLLARTIWGEARGEPVRGMEAVAAVVMNRVARPGWWGRTVASVCTKAYQFACWNEDDQIGRAHV